jgi:ubiquinone/menaquinone biosynthesis C-methylase UbiE/prolyl-tRNA editing enzyme YbaK/EbsC (Cys-tRNA(Pro) deacylase)
MNNWQSKKEAHKALSEVAAAKYDELYESANFATGSYMRYEAEIIKQWVEKSPLPRHLAIDLGCGTGRDTVILSKHFEQVFGYDFSPAMISCAQKRKLSNQLGNILFEVLDVENNMLPVDAASVGLVNTAFGMGSFVQHPDKLFREVRRVLVPGGIAIFSFYNSEALVNRLNLEWTPALAARLLPDGAGLRVMFEGSNYDIAAIPYTPSEIRKKLEGVFKVQELTTFPTLSALFPQSLFADTTARALCTKVDQLLATNIDIGAGPYIVAICQKGRRIDKVEPLSGYAKVLELIKHHNIPFDIREHAPVLTMDDVRNALHDIDHAHMVKSVLIAAEREKRHQVPQEFEKSPPELFLLAVPATMKADLSKFCKLIGKHRNEVRQASQSEVEDYTGFQTGNIPPFGLPRNIPIIVDLSIAQRNSVWCGTGKATESLKLAVDDLKKLSAFTPADIAKPLGATDTASE